MAPTQQSGPDEESKTNVLFRRLVIGIVSAVVVYALILLALAGVVPTFTFAASGTFGDSFGVLTALFSGLAFAGLIWTILLQRVELRLQRDELRETRRQAILTRVTTIVQNQTAAYRNEISVLQFKSIDDPTVEQGIHQMLYAMCVYLERLAKEHLEQSLTPERRLTLIAEYIRTVAQDLQGYEALIGGLTRCCKANRYLLANEAIEVNDAQDIKALFFSDLPTNLFRFVSQLTVVLNVALELREKLDIKKTPQLFDPLRMLRNDCEHITSHHALKFTADSLNADRKNKWIFSF